MDLGEERGAFWLGGTTGRGAMPVVDAIGLLCLRKLRHWSSLRHRRLFLPALFFAPSLHLVRLSFPCLRSILGLVYVSRSPPSSRYCIRGQEFLSRSPFYFPLSIYVFSFSLPRKSSLYGYHILVFHIYRVSGPAAASCPTQLSRDTWSQQKCLVILS